MENTSVCLLAFMLLSSLAFPANVHMASYRLDPSSIRPQQDFTLYLTFKNDAEYSVDGLDVHLVCPAYLSCPNFTSTLPPYGIQEFRLPIRSNASEGASAIKVEWNDGSSSFVYDDSTGNMSSAKTLYSSTINIDVKGRSFTNFTATSSLFANENSSFAVSFNTTSLHNVQVSLYSDCISFDRPLFYFDRIEQGMAISSPAYVNCREGNADVVFSLSSDELSYTAPLGVHIGKRPHARLSATFDASEHPVGKDYLLVKFENAGAAAEKLSLAVLPNSAVNSADVVYVGDFEGQKMAVFEIEGKKPGTYPIDVEARWSEGKESFVQTFSSQATFVDRGLGVIPIVVVLCLLAMAWLVTRKR